MNVSLIIHAWGSQRGLVHILVSEKADSSETGVGRLKRLIWGLFAFINHFGLA